jgi:hypothetical protein
MTHKATLTLPIASLKVKIGVVPVSMICLPFEVDVEYDFRAGLPANEEGPAETDTFIVQAVRLVRSLAMHDSADTLSLVWSPGVDLLPYLEARTVSWIEENLPVPA